MRDAVDPYIDWGALFPEPRKWFTLAPPPEGDESGGGGDDKPAGDEGGDPAGDDKPDEGGDPAEKIYDKSGHEGGGDDDDTAGDDDDTAGDDDDGGKDDKPADKKDEGEDGDDGGKGDDEAEEQAGAPEQYEPFKLEEGQALDEGRLSRFHEYAKEHGWTQEQAQEHVSFVMDEIMQPMLDESQGLWNKTVSDWHATVNNDPEVGGPNFKANMDKINQMIDHVLTKGATGDALEGRKGMVQQTLQRLAETGFGNEPGLVLFMHKVTSLFEEDVFHTSQHHGGGKTGAQAIYTSMENP